MQNKGKESENQKESNEIIKNLQKKRKIKRILIIGIIIFLISILMIISVVFYKYFNSPEKELGISGDIESFMLSEDGEVSYLGLKAGSLDKNISKVKFVFRGGEGEHVYETSEGAEEISVPYKENFWDWLFKREKYNASYDYSINADEMSLNDFDDINNVSVSFVYEDEGVEKETEDLDTQKKGEDDDVVVGSPGGSSPSSGPSNDGGGGSYCGDGTCDADENCSTCPEDCGECPAECGNDIIESGETCDGTGLEKTCGDFGFLGGEISCLDNCSGYNTSSCTEECKIENDCYYVSVSGNGSHNGSEGNEMNLSEAMDYANSNTDTKIMFLLSSGSYGAIDYVSTQINRTEWVTYKALGNVNMAYFSYEGQSFDNGAYIRIVGINFPVPKGGDGWYDRSIYLNGAHHFEFINLTITGDGYHLGEGGTGILTQANDLTLINITVNGLDRKDLAGVGSCLYISGGERVMVSDSDFSKCYTGISIGTCNDCLIKNNRIHNINSDGIVYGSGNNITFEDNKVYNIHIYKPELAENPLETEWGEDGLIMNNSNANWNGGYPYDALGTEIYIHSGDNVNLGDKEIYVINVSSDGKQINLGGNVSSGGQPSNVNYTLRAGAHIDIIQHNGNTGAYNITIRGNEFFYSDEYEGFESGHQIAWLNPVKVYHSGECVVHNDVNYLSIRNGIMGIEPGVHNDWEDDWEINDCGEAEPWTVVGGNDFIIENNVWWGTHKDGQDEHANVVYLGAINKVLFRNNTVIGRLMIGASNASIINNIIGYITNNAELTETDYNIINRGGAGYDLGIYDKYLDSDWDSSEYIDIFYDYYDADFRPITASIACDGSVNEPNVAVGALDCLGCVDDNPLAVFKYMQQDDYDVEIEFDATDSLSCDNSITEYSWDFGDGYTDSGTQVIHTYKAGSYTINLTVINNLGNTNSKAKQITILPSAEPGLSVYLNFDNNVVDLSGKGNDGIVCNNTGCDIEADYVSGKVKQAISFDGTVEGSYLYVDNDETLEFTNAFTLMGWAKKNNPDSGQWLFYKHTLYSLTIGSNVINYGVQNGTELTGNVNIQADSINNTDWHHYVLTYNSSDVKLYLDGKEIDSRPFLGILYPVYWNLHIGKNPWGNSLNGSIDEVMIYNRVLNNSEIQEIYCIQGDGSEEFCSQYLTSLSPLTKIWNFVKSLLTGKTGNAILTGDVIGNGNKRVYAWGLLGIVSLLIIVIVWVVKVRESKKRIGRKK